jgi:hypothetical protein
VWSRPVRTPARAALEGYRSRRLGESAVRRLLGFGTRMEVHGFLKEHGVYLNYSMEDLEHDIHESDRILAIRHAHDAAGEHHPR